MLLDAGGQVSAALGEHRGCHLHTIGQRVRLPGRRDRTYVVGKSVSERLLFVVDEASHFARYTAALVARAPQWTDPAGMAVRLAAGPLACLARARHQQPLFACTVSLWPPEGGIVGVAASGVGYVPPGYRTEVVVALLVLTPIY